jgi:hypothetical protein
MDDCQPFVSLTQSITFASRRSERSQTRNSTMTSPSLPLGVTHALVIPLPDWAIFAEKYGKVKFDDLEGLFIYLRRVAQSLAKNTVVDLCSADIKIECGTIKSYLFFKDDHDELNRFVIVEDKTGNPIFYDIAMPNCETKNEKIIHDALFQDAVRAKRYCLERGLPWTKDMDSHLPCTDDFDSPQDNKTTVQMPPQPTTKDKEHV